MSEISKAYNPSEVEDKWYKTWVESGCFKGNPDPSKEAYSIVIPPPNVTGVLTMGHVLNNTIQDILIRRARQMGKSAIWIPGTDHAGVATQTKVDAYLRKEHNTCARDLGREKFLETAKQWRDKHGGIIIEQLKKLGASCDWDRLVHTLDDDYSKGVLTAFVHLFKKGYIYRGKRMVNWCPVNLTALSDEEVIMKPQKSKLFKMKYELVDEPGTFLEIATTRPETIMGDTAVAVNPKDPRYAHLVGKKIWRPFPKAEITIIGDEYVDMKFGTGVLKVTPAHDPADFELAQRHNLPIIEVMNADATMNELAGEDFCGLDRFVAREKAVEKLREMGQLIAVEDYDNNVGFSERGGQPIEPRLSDQWFMRYPKVAEAKAAVESGAIKFWPKRWEKTYTHWLENIRDWCISRQIWWGHRIPVWYKKGIENHDINNPEHVHVSVEGPADPENWVQDEDSLDTWASSWIWPFGTMGWPNSDAEKQKAMSYFYPTSDLVTGPDIIFFWVARMIMAGLEFLPEDMPEKIPFRNVYFTGIIRDMLGRKMSKSLGNSPDPLDIIARYGADGLRFGVMNCAPQGQDILFSEERVEIGRNFCNKLWNACRFRQMSSEMSQNGSLEEIVSRIDASKLDADDHAIIASLINVSKQISKDYLNYQFNSITQSLYSFFWNDFCGWYLEVSKSRMADETAKGTVLAVQDLCIRQMLLMLHPFTPFITEELWHSMSFGKEGSFIQNECPEFAEKLVALGLNINSTAVAETEKLKDFVSKARALKAQCNLATKRDSILMLLPSDDTAKTLFEANTGKLKKLVGASEITVVAQQPDAPAMLSELGSIYVDMKGAVDAEAEIKRLEKDKAKLEGAIKSAQARLANEAFTSKAPQNVIDGAKKQLEENIAKLAEIEKLIANFKA
ncbi:MAG: valine--tRNA ligase [Verrucomicrobiaceae bacterium]|nr:valine--tRNA ligase [Verrucomicrobiaceae bacterium]